MMLCSTAACGGDDPVTPPDTGTSGADAAVDAATDAGGDDGGGTNDDAQNADVQVSPCVAASNEAIAAIEGYPGTEDFFAESASMACGDGLVPDPALTAHYAEQVDAVLTVDDRIALRNEASAEVSYDILYAFLDGDQVDRAQSGGIAYPEVHGVLTGDTPTRVQYFDTTDRTLVTYTLDVPVRAVLLADAYACLPDAPDFENPAALGVNPYAGISFAQTESYEWVRYESVQGNEYWRFIWAIDVDGVVSLAEETCSERSADGAWIDEQCGERRGTVPVTDDLPEDWCGGLRPVPDE
ncbi:MAG: hypothetical protein ACI81R_001880 [Bradymonadia bacterium]|jgi:hypothetical protein